MAYKNNKGNSASASSSTSYVDFEPRTELKEDDTVDTLIISLPGFRKEHLRVQVSSTGILKVSGEKPENPEGTIKQRFVKETKVPSNCDMNEIRAKFTTGQLYVLMPKKVVVAVTPTPTPTPTKSSDVVSTATAQSDEHDTEPKNSVGHADQRRQGKTTVLGLRTRLAELRGRKMRMSKTVVIGFGVGVAMVAMVAIGAYVAYTYGSSSTLTSSSFMEE